jgi:uncharacterized protein YrzB (UPF0473 family)
MENIKADTLDSSKEEISIEKLEINEKSSSTSVNHDGDDDVVEKKRSIAEILHEIIGKHNDIFSRDIDNHERLYRALGLINTEEYLKKCREISMDDGNGIHLFKFKNQVDSEGSNCTYTHIVQNTNEWEICCKMIHPKILDHFDGDKNFLLMITIPKNFDFDDEIISITQIFDFMKLNNITPK